jgi:hypothetical protein
MKSRMLVFFGLAVLAIFAAVSLACALPNTAADSSQSGFPVLSVSMIVAAEAFLAVAIRLTLGKSSA